MKAGLVIIAAIIIGGLTAWLMASIRAKHACEEAVIAAQSRLYVEPGAEAEREAAFKAALESKACRRTEGMSRTVLSLAD